MALTFQDCQLIGRRLEEQVACKLSAAGFSVFRNLYIPYYPDSEEYAEVDVVAVYGSAVLTVECKNFYGILRGAISDKRWENPQGTYARKVCNPIRQSASHRDAVKSNLLCDVYDLIVLGDGTVYQGPSIPKVIRFSELDGIISTVKAKMQEKAITQNNMFCMMKLRELQESSAEIRRKHTLQVHRYKNAGVAEEVKNLRGVDAFCVMVLGEYFYALTDEDGHHWATEKLEEAALFDTEDEAAEVAFRMERDDAEVCTLQLGGIERVRDLPDELDDLSIQEYADAIGARPW